MSNFNETNLINILEEIKNSTIKKSDWFWITLFYLIQLLFVCNHTYTTNITLLTILHSITLIILISIGSSKSLNILPIGLYSLFTIIIIAIAIAFTYTIQSIKKFNNWLDNL